MKGIRRKDIFGRTYEPEVWEMEDLGLTNESMSSLSLDEDDIEYLRWIGDDEDIADYIHDVYERWA